MRAPLIKHYLPVVACICAILGGSASAGARTIKNRSLKDLDGRPTRLWHKRSTVSVLLFFKVDHKYTMHAFRELERCRKDIGSRPVSFLGVVSGDEKKANIKRLLSRVKIKIKVVIDPRRQLASELGIRAYPTFAIYQVKKARLVLQPTQRIGLCESLLAKLKFALGEINESQRKKEEGGGEGITHKHKRSAQRYAKLAMLLHSQKQYGHALSAIQQSIRKDSAAARAHAILGTILVDLRKCKEAARAFKRALALDRNDELARTGQKRSCK